MGLFIGKKKSSKSDTIQLSLSESRLLFKKYLELGCSEEESDARVKKVKKHLKLLQDSLRMQNKEQKEINEAFYREYEKLLCEAENGRFG